MAQDITFTIIKPDAVAKGFIGKIITMIINAGFTVAAMKLTRLTPVQAEQFYNMHKEKPFFGGLIQFMSSGPIVALILQKDNAVSDYRELIGNTDPAKAQSGTIRQLFAESVQRNAVHGSDSDQSAQIEADFFFSQSERYFRDKAELVSE